MRNLDLTDRKTLMASLPHGGVVAEIGVAGGGFSVMILELNQPRELWLIDSWEYQSVEVVGHDPSNVHQEGHDGQYQSVLQRYQDVPEVHVMRAYSLAAAISFPDAYLDGIYFDANHLQLNQDLVAWWPKIKSGGWMAGHDYTMVGDFITVKADLDKFVKERGLNLFVTRGDTDIYEKNYPSWMFRRP